MQTILNQTSNQAQDSLLLHNLIFLYISTVILAIQNI